MGSPEPRIVAYGVVVIDEPLAGIPSVRAYAFQTLLEASAGVLEAIEHGCTAHYAPIRRGDILPEEWRLSSAVRGTPSPEVLP